MQSFAARFPRVRIRNAGFRSEDEMIMKAEIGGRHRLPLLAPLLGAIVIPLVSRWYRPLSRTQPRLMALNPPGSLPIVVPKDLHPSVALYRVFYPASSNQHPASSNQHPASSNQQPASRLPPPASRIPHLLSIAPGGEAPAVQARGSIFAVKWRNVGACHTIRWPGKCSRCA
jgi:hypothetical protein